MTVDFIYDSAEPGYEMRPVGFYRNFSRLTGTVQNCSQCAGQVLTRLMAFILLCIGLQIMWHGWEELNAIPH